MNRNTAPLSALRIKAGLSQEDLAVQVGVTSAHMCRVERGRVRPSSELLQKMAKRLRVAVAELEKSWAKARRAYLRAEGKA